MNESFRELTGRFESLEEANQDYKDKVAEDSSKMLEKINQTKTDLASLERRFGMHKNESHEKNVDKQE